MTIQDTIIKALEASHSAHESILARIEMMMSERKDLLKRIAELEARVAELEAEAVKIVEPTAVQSLLTALAEVVDRTSAAVRPTPLPSDLAPSETDHHRGEPRRADASATEAAAPRQASTDDHPSVQEHYAELDA